MAEHTPTTDEIVEFIRAADHLIAHRFSEATDAVDAFHRWLAVHDAEVRVGVVTEASEWEYVPGWIGSDGRARISQGLIVPEYVADFIAEGGEVVRRRVTRFEIVTAGMAPAKQDNEAANPEVGSHDAGR